jgi:acyl dehydratase
MLYAEDLREGQEFPFGSYPMVEDEMLAFARQYDPIPIHTDPAAAAASPFGGLIASGLHTMAIYQRLIVEAMWTRVAGIAGRSFQIRLSKPVRAGNKLTGRARITTITHRSERHDAVVIISSNVTTEDGETVLAVVLDTLVAARPMPSA